MALQSERSLAGPRSRAGVLALLASLAATLVSAAVIENRSVVIELEGDGFTATEAFTVAIEGSFDAEAWESWAIELDDHIDLVSWRAEVLDDSGRVIEKVPRKALRRVESPGFELFTSAWLSIIPFPALAAGDRIRVETVTRHRPVFPATSVPLVVGTSQRRLRVEVRGGAGGLRWRVEPEDPAFAVSSDDESVVVEASDVPAYDAPKLAPSWQSARPLLWLRWGGGDRWCEVGDWYTRLSDGVERRGEALSDLAGRLCDPEGSRRECVEALVRHIQRNVRYEAVEVGRGGWVPSAAAEVLGRGWGDCKDMSFLLRSVLERAGIPARLALLSAGRDGRIPTDFPTPFVFNHCIVAIPADDLDLRGDDPVAGGYLIVDPTSERGSVAWLPPECQGRPMLVADGANSRLVATPLLPGKERRSLEVTGALDDEGRFEGSARLTLTGRSAVGWIELLRTGRESEVLEAVQTELNRLIPRVRVKKAGWRAVDDGVPTTLLDTQVSCDGLVSGRPPSLRLRLPYRSSTPDSRLLDGRLVPVVLRPGVDVTRWTLRLPSSWPLPQSRERRVDGPIGSFAEVVSTTGDGTVVVEHRTELRRTSVAPAELGALRELCVAERRAARRTLVLTRERSTSDLR